MTESTQTVTAPAAPPGDGVLQRFCHSPAAQIARPGLGENSTGAILACAFLMGAAEALGGRDDRAALLEILVSQLGVTDRGARHLHYTTGRLLRRYPFVVEIAAQGRQAAAAWQRGEAGGAQPSLAQVLERHRSLTLMELESLPQLPPETPAAEADSAPAPPPDRSRAKALFAVLLLVVMVVANYLAWT